MQFDLTFPSVRGQTEDNVLCKDPQKLNLVFTAANIGLAEGLHLRAFAQLVLV